MLPGPSMLPSSKKPQQSPQKPLWKIEQFAVPRCIHPWGLEPEVPSLVNHTGVKQSSVKSAMMEEDHYFSPFWPINVWPFRRSFFILFFLFFCRWPRGCTPLYAASALWNAQGCVANAEMRGSGRKFRVGFVREWYNLGEIGEFLCEIVIVGVLVGDEDRFHRNVYSTMCRIQL